MQNNTLVIVGMHRSGTSLIAHWLGRCGLEIGDNLLGPGIGNVDGHFEDTEFYNAHISILNDLGFPDSGITTYKVRHVEGSQVETIKKIIDSKNERYRQWAWKDPRTCLFLNVYKQLLPDARYLVVLRDYRSVVISLLKRSFAEYEADRRKKQGYISRVIWDKIKRKRKFHKFCALKASFFLDVWIHYNEEILRFIRHIAPENYLVINYQLLKQDDQCLFDHLTEAWGFRMKYSDFSEIYNEKLISSSFDIDRYLPNPKQKAKATLVTRQLLKCVKVKTTRADHIQDVLTYSR